MLSPGIIGTYWLLASFAATTAWTLTARHIKRTAHRATARCYCGTCDR